MFVESENLLDSLHDFYFILALFINLFLKKIMLIEMMVPSLWCL